MKSRNFKLLALAIILCIIISGCTGQAETNVAGNMIVPEANPVSDRVTDAPAVEKIELFHFHMTRQCYSCKTVGAYAEETVNTYFSDELESGKLVFDHINAELPENRELATRYGATGSSLWIGTYKTDGSFSKEENNNVWYKINDKQEYIAYLKQVIEQKLE